MKYTTASTLLFLYLIVFCVITKSAYAQNSSAAGAFYSSLPNMRHRQFPFSEQFKIPSIDPLFSQQANYTRHLALCPPTGNPTLFRCFGEVIINNTMQPFITNKPAGFGPAEFRKAYTVPGEAMGNPIVAIIDAYDQPHMISDLQAYSATFNLPQLPLCKRSIANSAIPCFKKVSQTGTEKYPKSDAGWALEISLDVETVHAMCDNCRILLIEATSPTNANLMKAVDTAVKLGATVLSNSYGGGETFTEKTYDRHFNHPGIAIFASSGDSGYGVSYPAASQYVIAVGGTRLNLKKTGSYSSESAWSDGGSGCSSFETKPSWQQDTGCKKRTVADVSADADPYSGAAVYDSVVYHGQKGWFKIGGTSLASPLVAGIFATSVHLANNQQAGTFLYHLTSNHFHDIKRGRNGYCSPAYLCKANKGYDGPTGLGSPKGVF